MIWYPVWSGWIFSFWPFWGIAPFQWPLRRQPCASLHASHASAVVPGALHQGLACTQRNTLDYIFWLTRADWAPTLPTDRFNNDNDGINLKCHRYWILSEVYLDKLSCVQGYDHCSHSPTHTTPCVTVTFSVRGGEFMSGLIFRGGAFFYSGGHLF